MKDPVFYNNYSTTIVGVLLAGATSIDVADIGSLVTPGAGEFLRLTLFDPRDLDKFEILDITDVTGVTLTFTRGAELSVDQEWSSESPIEARETAGMLAALGYDTGGNARGADSVNIQPSRTDDANVASGVGAVSIGANSSAAGDQSTSIGGSASADGQFGTASGTNALANFTGAVAYGPYANAGATYAIALGYNLDVTDNNGIGIGRNTLVEGANAFGVGQDVKASADFDIAINMSTYDNAALTAWAATTVYAAGAVIPLGAGTTQIAVCIEGGTSAASEPTGSDHTVVTDNTAKWLIVPSSSASDFANVAIGWGGGAYGGGNFAGGTNASAVGGSVAVGQNSKGWGQGAVGILGEARHRQAIAVSAIVPDYRSIGIGAYNANIGRTPVEAMQLGITGKYMPFDYAESNQHLPFVDHHDWWHVGGADIDESMVQHTREVTFYSVPIQAGDEVWVASTVYEHGHAVLPTVGNGYSYVAYVYPGDYFESGTTGGSEPTWPTTPGDSVTDNGVDWVCVDPADIQFVIPDYTRFTPTSVGVMARQCSGGATTQPEVSFGISGDLDKWLVATTLTKMSGTGASEFINPTNTEYAKQFGAALTTAGTDIDCTLVFALKGYIIEELSV